MGSSYANIHVRSDDQNAVKRALTQINALPAFVSKPKNGWVSAYPSDVESQAEDTMKQICSQLSGTVNAGVIGIIVHDSDVFLYTLAENGQVVDQYNSWPGYFDGTGDTPSGGKVEKLLPYCAAGTTSESLRKLLESGGKGLDSSFPVGDVGSMMKKQLVKASPWWAKPAVWGAVTVFQAAQKGKSAASPTLTPTMSPEMLDMIWKGDKMATAFAGLLAIDQDRISSGYDHIDEDDAPVDRRSLALVGDRSQKKEYVPTEEDLARAADSMKEMTCLLRERPAFPAFLAILNTVLEASPEQEEFKRVCVSKGLKFKQSKMDMMGLAESPVWWSFIMESDQFLLRKFQLTAVPKKGTVNCASCELSQIADADDPSFAKEYEYAFSQAAFVLGPPSLSGRDAQDLSYAAWKGPFAYLFLLQSPAGDLAARPSIDIWWEPWAESSQPQVTGCLKEWLEKRHPDLF